MASGPPLFKAAGRKTTAVPPRLNVQNPSNAAQEPGKVGEESETPSAATAAAALACRGERTSMACANLAWPPAKVGLRGDSSMQAIWEEAAHKAAGSTAESLANLAWAHAMVGTKEEPSSGAAAEQALTVLRGSGPHDVAYLARAPACVKTHRGAVAHALAELAHQHVDGFNVEDLAKSSWSWATTQSGTFAPLVHGCIRRATRSAPVSSWNTGQFLDTGHAFVWASWTTEAPELGWDLFNSWASQGMTFDAASCGHLMMDAAFSKSAAKEASIMQVMERSSAFPVLKDIFEWARGPLAPPELEYAMRFDTRVVPGTDRRRGTHAKLALLVDALLLARASDAPSILEAIREFSHTQGAWLKVAGGAKANVIEDSLRRRRARPAEAALEFGVFVGYTTVRIAQRAYEDNEARERKERGPLLVGLEVEPVHVCVARWVLDLARLSPWAEVWSGMAHDLLLRVGDELGQRSVRLCFMDHRGTRFHEDLALLEESSLLAPRARVIADNVLKPAAPVFCWVVRRSSSYDGVNYAVGEFVQSSCEDWMVVADFVRPGGRAPPAPEALHRLAWDSDKWRRRSEEDSVLTSEWAAFAQHAREIFLAHGLEATPWLN